MKEIRRDVGREILQGLRELKCGEHGRVINVPDLNRIRKEAGLSQVQFARLMGVSVPTLQDWEQARRRPSGAARTLLQIAARNLQAVLDVA
ncbi:MAG: helix-turn-helix domain-containing protein [Gemmatimonadetes bacterium]|nr:helix-turn-helix domain-containing protein [Gemmatimonadota bacterium]